MDSQTIPRESSNTSVTIKEVNWLDAGELQNRNPEASLPGLDQLECGANSRNAKQKYLLSCAIEGRLPLVSDREYSALAPPKRKHHERCFFGQ